MYGILATCILYTLSVGQQYTIPAMNTGQIHLCKSNTWYRSVDGEILECAGKLSIFSFSLTGGLDAGRTLYLYNMSY